MFGVRVVALVLTILWLRPTSLQAQSEALMDAYNQGQTHYQAGHYEQAIPFFREALELGEQEFGPDHPTTATLLNNLAAMNHAQGRYEAAKPLLKRALTVREKALGLDHPDVATGLENYAALLRETGRDDEAVTLEVHAKAIRAKHGEENP